mmetsp:Transcript_118978/g.237174  ORF Transcript_118978/g.237174 Transcript_118978/m.237174 type:complete len:89 (+) Transcript_118978:682-948(+)
MCQRLWTKFFKLKPCTELKLVGGQVGDPSAPLLAPSPAALLEVGTARQAFGSLPAPKDGLTDDSTMAKFFATGLQPSADPQYIIRKLQ